MQVSISFWDHIRTLGEERLPFTFEEFSEQFFFSLVTNRILSTSQKNASSFPLVKSGCF